MDWLEQELREALNRKDPAPDFAGRVRRSIEAPKQPPAQGSQWRLPVAAVLVIAAGAGGIGYRQHQGEVARQQVMQAFRIAGSRLNHIQSQVREVRR